MDCEFSSFSRAYAGRNKCAFSGKYLRMRLTTIGNSRIWSQLGLEEAYTWSRVLISMRMSME